MLRSPPWLGRPLWNICATNDHGYVLLVVNTSFPHSRLITGFVTRLTRRVSIVEQELLTLPEHLSSPPVFSRVRVTRSLVLYVCFVDRCLSFCTFFFDHCVVCSSSIYGFWLPLWYLQTPLEHHTILPDMRQDEKMISALYLMGNYLISKNRMWGSKTNSRLTMLLVIFGVIILSTNITHLPNKNEYIHM